MIKRIYPSFPVLNSLRAKVTHIFMLYITISLFLIIYNPFDFMDSGSKEWTNIVLSSSIVAVIFSLIATISLFFYRKKIKSNRFMLYDYILMVIINIVTCSILFSLGSISITDYLNSVLVVLSITIIPYLLATSFSFIVYLIKDLIEKRALLESAKKENKVELVYFQDDYGSTSFYLDKNSVLYIEANDNYINIYYWASQKVSCKILRTSMKTVEPLLKIYSMIRCHRSYIVNIQKVNSIQKQKGQLKLSLYDTDFMVPVSRTFANEVEQTLKISHLNELQ